jgi:hypothetical protein
LRAYLIPTLTEQLNDFNVLSRGDCSCRETAIHRILSPLRDQQRSMEFPWMVTKDKVAAETPGQIITKTIPNFRKMADLGNSKTHDLINKGLTDEYGNTLIDEDGHELKLQTVAVGSRRHCH